MSDIIDNEELDKDTVDPEELEQLFSKKYNLIATKEVSSKKVYINKINGTKSLKLAVSLSNNTIEVYELASSSLNQVCRLSGHSKTVTEVVFSPKEDHLLYSSGQDGVLKLWDTRASGTCVQEYKDEDEQVLKPYDCMDVSCNGRVLCGGSALAQDDAYLVFWDQRQTTPLGGYWNTHTDDITQVKFHKRKVDTLVSGSEDGLLNVYNISEQTEDEALVYSLNVGNSVSCVGWLDDTTITCVSQGHELSVWDTDTGDLKHSFDREKIAKSIRRSKVDDCYVGGRYSPGRTGTARSCACPGSAATGCSRWPISAETDRPSATAGTTKIATHWCVWATPASYRCGHTHHTRTHRTHNDWSPT